MTGPEERSQSPDQARPASAPPPHDRSFGPAAPAQQPRAEAPAHREPHLAPAHPHHEAPTTHYPQAPAHQPVQQAPAGVPPRPSPLPPPRSTTATTTLPPRGPSRPGGATQSPRPVTRGRRARLTLRRIDPWSVFLWTVVASIFLGLALLVAVAVLYSLLSSMGVIESLNELIGDVTAEPGETAVPSDLLDGGKILSVAAVVAAVDVVLLTALATLGAFLYNLCAALTGGIEVTLGDRE